ncbi:hypothetical protein [Microbacterium sp. NPDC079995]|uniref:hypothetical protein n=1 Tax=unclassified Microbacterium TaxID=2609290 RepID=UPI00344E2B24
MGEDSDLDYRYSQGVLTSFDVDVVHVAEPHLDMLLGTKGAAPYQRVLASSIFVRNLRRNKISLVQTLWNESKSEEGRMTRIARRILDKATDAFIVFDASVNSPNPKRTAVVPHAHFGDRFVGYPRRTKISGRVACLAHGYLPLAAKGLLGISRVTDADVTLRLAGAATKNLSNAITSAVAERPTRVSARLERLSDAALVQEITTAELVVLPRLETLEDLQMVFFALSMDRPVLTVRSPSLNALSASVGEGWLHLSESAITARDVDSALAASRQVSRTPSPNLAGRDLSTIRNQYETIFRRVTRRDTSLTG